MSTIDCATCGRFMLDPKRHECPPQWSVWCPDNGDEADCAEVVRAYSAETAAEEWAKLYDGPNDYTIVGGSPATVCVRLEGSENVVRFEVSGESQPVYTATAVEGGTP